MPKGYYIRSKGKKAFAGVDRKVRNQIKVLSKEYEMQELLLMKEPTNVIKSLMWRMPFGSFGRDYASVIKEIDNPRFIYIRSCYNDKRFVNFLKTLRENWPDTKILIEIPTYPYDKEILVSRTEWPYFFKDIAHRHMLKKYVDRIVTFSEDERIFGIPCIATRNGIMASEISPIKPFHREDDTIRLLAVAQFQPSHGYERIIKSLKEYYLDSNHTRRVELHMVGYGTEEKLYRELVAKFGLEKYVFFYGAKSGAELDACYENMDAGLGCFGLYKKNLEYVSSLKSVEYMAKGLPVINGYRERLMDGAEEYFKLFDNSDTPIDMCEIIDYLDNLYQNDITHENCIFQIHKLSMEKADMSVVMEPILSYIRA